MWVRPGTHAFYFIFNNRCQPPRACRHGCPAVEHGLLHLSWPGGKCFPRQLEKDRSNIVWRPIARCGHGQAVPQHAAPHPSCSPSSRRNHAECLACSDTSYVCHGFCVHCTIAPPWKKTVCLAAMKHDPNDTFNRMSISARPLDETWSSCFLSIATMCTHTHKL